MTLEAIANLVPEAVANKEEITKRKKIRFSMWKFNTGYINASKHLRKTKLRGSRPNKIVVAVCWLIVIVAMIIAFLKIVFWVF